MIRSFLIAAMLCCVAFAGPAGAALAQKRVTSDYLLELKSKLETRRDAYYRFEMAEKDALADGSRERAEVFRKAKDKAYQEYVTLNAELQKAQMEKREYDKRIASQAPSER